MSFDIVIPLGPNEKNNIQRQIEYTKRNVMGYRNIYLVSYDPTIQVEDCIVVDEKVFPFSIKDVASYHGARERNGWYLQQLLKLYAGFVIDGILDRYLIIDADVFFLKPISFITDDGKPIYTLGYEYHVPYFQHMARLDPELKKCMNFSGICHHMMFQRSFVSELFQMVEKNHPGLCFWKIFLQMVDTAHKDTSGASEYEMYFHYMVKHHPDQIAVRELKWQNVSKYFDLTSHSPCDYVSLCHYIN